MNPTTELLGSNNVEKLNMKIELRANRQNNAEVLEFITYINKSSNMTARILIEKSIDDWVIEVQSL